MFFLLGLSLLMPLYAQPILNPEQKTSAYFETIKNDPLQLYIFLNKMPKGGDIHNHLAGATYAEDEIKYGQKDSFCIDPDSFLLTFNPKCPPNLRLANAYANPDFYRDIVEHWSMLDFRSGEEKQMSNEAHFFTTFGLLGEDEGDHTADALQEVVSRAGTEHVSYLELLLTPYDLNLVGPQGEYTAIIGEKAGISPDFAVWRKNLLAAGLPAIVTQISQRLTVAEAKMHTQMHCGTLQADPGCGVTVRYQYLALRGLPPDQFFAQLVTAFAVASKDPRIVGINIVQAEDGPIAIRDYNLHMQMLHYLHQVYPNVHITLHAGELAPGSVPPEALRFHIRNAIEIGDAERIGHGADIAYEDNAQQLLTEMATKHILVEECLTSNATLLHIHGPTNPLPLYVRYHVPVTLATDDEGVLRTTLTREYQRAVLTYHFTYAMLKRFARNSLTYAFISGASLWQDPNMFIAVVPCQKDILGTETPSATCQQFLAHSQKARLQWQLEKQFNVFEKQIAANP
jgi:adenosine deaminase